MFFSFTKQHTPSYWSPCIDHHSKRILTKILTTHPTVRTWRLLSSAWTHKRDIQILTIRRWWWRDVDGAWRASGTTQSVQNICRTMGELCSELGGGYAKKHCVMNWGKYAKRKCIQNLRKCAKTNCVQNWGEYAKKNYSVRYIQEINGCFKFDCILKCLVQTHNSVNCTYRKLTALIKWLVYWNICSRYITHCTVFKENWRLS
jgi:hypothetical protein